MKLGPSEEQMLYGYDGFIQQIYLDDMTRVGHIGLFYQNDKAFTDILIFYEFRNKGYATQAYKLLLDARKDIDIYACVNIDNYDSNHLHRKLGFELISTDGGKNIYKKIKENKNDY